MLWIWGITYGCAPTPCWTIETITLTNSVPTTQSLDHLGGYPPGRLREVISQVVWPSRQDVLGHTRVFSYRAGQPSKSCRVPKSVPTQGCQLCHGCLYWRCTQARNDQQTDVIPFFWVFLMQVWPNTIYYWGRLCLVVPTGGGPCSAGTPTLVGI